MRSGMEEFIGAAADDLGDLLAGRGERETLRHDDGREGVGLAEQVGRRRKGRLRRNWIVVSEMAESSSTSAPDGDGVDVALGPAVERGDGVAGEDFLTRRGSAGRHGG